MILTYNQIIKEFNDFANAHKQIQNFGNGDLFEITGDRTAGSGKKL